MSRPALPRRAARTPGRPPLGRAAAAAAAVLLLGACAGPGADPAADAPSGGATGAVVEGVPEDLRGFYAQTVQWEPCAFEAETGGADRDLRCAAVEVPVDWDEPAGPTTEVVMARLAADGESRGALLLNPGGPGVSGVDAMLSAEGLVSADVREAYDVVGFDPRGVGRSAGVQCLDDAELDAWRQEPAFDPETQSADEIRDQYERLGRACTEEAGELVGHLGTESAARDMDVLRAVLGQERTDYLGFSYGTHLGAVYAELFPERAGRMVLDGGVDPTLSNAEAIADQAESFERTLRHWVRHCQEEIRGCVVEGTEEQALERIQELIATAAEGGLTAADGRRVTATSVVEGILAPLYSPSTYEGLDKALGSAFSGDPTALLQLSDATHGRSPEGEYTTNTTVAFTAISCLDQPDSPMTDEQLAAHQEELTRRSPTFGPYLGYGEAACQGWPLEAEGEPRPVDAEGSDPLLVVGTVHDPATPYAWSQALVEQLDNARLLTYDGWGHTAYTSGSACVREAVDAYLLEGELPAEGTTCS